MTGEEGARVRLYLAGAFFLTLDDEPIQAFHSNKTKALLAYLALEAQEPLPREQVAKLFWEGYTRQSARTSLRVALYDLRQLLGPYSDLLVGTRNTVQFRSDDPNFWCDVLQLEQLANATHSAESETALDKFDRLLLAGFEDVDSAAFLDWLAMRRDDYAGMIDHLQTQALQAVGQQHNLPRLLTTIFGRQSEIEQLKKQLADPTTPLITVIGAGGVGKTTLALTTARQLTKQFRDGVWVVPLDRLVPTVTNDAAQHVAHAIARTLNFIPRHDQPLPEQLISYLNEQQMLLILDNFEHLQAATPFVLELLAATEQLTVLITSRKPLNVMAERRLYLDGLPVPKTMEHDAPSVALFCDRIQNVTGSVDFDAQNWEAVGAICRTLNGLPLGIELAAIACEQTTPRHLLTHIQENLAVLETDMTSFPERQRNLWSVMLYTWQMLALEEQRSFLQCSFLHGTFSADAITQITQAPTAIIRTFVQYGLLTPVSENDYTMHAQLREFCGQQANSTPALDGWMRQAQQRHATYFLNWISEQVPALIEQPTESCAAIRQQFDNLEQAWHWAVRSQADDLLRVSCHALGQFFQRSGSASTGIHWLQAAIQAILSSKLPPVPSWAHLFDDPIQREDERQQLVALLRLELAALWVTVRTEGEALADVHDALNTAAMLSPTILARAALIEGTIQREKKAYAQSIILLENALAHYAVAPASALQRELAIQTAYQLGHCYASTQQFERAYRVWRQAETWAETNHDNQRKAQLLLAIGQTAYEQGAFEQALTACEQGLTLNSQWFEITLRYYAGLSALQVGSPDIAQAHMRTMIKLVRLQRRDSTAIIREVEGLLGLCEAQLANGNAQAARRSVDSALGKLRRIGRKDLALLAQQLQEKVQARLEPSRTHLELSLSGI